MKYKILLALLLILAINSFNYGGDTSVGTSIYQKLQQTQLLNSNNSNSSGFFKNVRYYVRTKKLPQESNSDPKPEKKFLKKIINIKRTISKNDSYLNKKGRPNLSFQATAKKLQANSKKIF